MTARPGLVSVIIPVYNGEAYLAEAIDSVRTQRHRPLEIIVVDDGSTDNTAEVASRFKADVLYRYQPNGGPAAARNTGLRMARGDSIGFVDADDMWAESKLEIQLGHLVDHPSVDIVIGLIQNVKALGLVDGRHATEQLEDPRISLSLGCSLFRRAVFEKVGLFDEALFYCDDWDWFMRARELGVPMMSHQDVTLFARRHEDNLTNKVEVGNHYALRMLKKSLDRRRRSPGQDRSLPKLVDLKDRPPAGTVNDA